MMNGTETDPTSPYDAKVYAAVREELALRKADLERQLHEVNVQWQAFESADSLVVATMERVRQGASEQILSVQDVHGKSQREILRLLAGRNNGWLVVQEAIRAMTDAGIFSRDQNASAQVYTLMRDGFTQVLPGIYRVNPEIVTFKRTIPQRLQLSSDGSTGLSKEVARIVSEHPDWTRLQVTEDLLRNGWDFGEKKPTAAVSICFATVARVAKAKQRRAEKKRQPPQLLIAHAAP